MCETSCSSVPEECHSWELTFQLCFACLYISKVSKDKMKVLDAFETPVTLQVLGTVAGKDFLKRRNTVVLHIAASP